MKFTTAHKGMLALLQVQQRAIERGVTVSLPTTDSVRYDAVIDDGTRLYRVQIKYCDRRPTGTSGAVALELTTYHRSGKLSYAGYSEKEIDAILVYVPRIDKVLWFGPEIFAGRKEIQIRLEPTKSGQKKSCLFAKDHIW